MSTLNITKMLVMIIAPRSMCYDYSESTRRLIGMLPLLIVPTSNVKWRNNYVDVLVCGLLMGL